MTGVRDFHSRWTRESTVSHTIRFDFGLIKRDSILEGDFYMGEQVIIRTGYADSEFSQFNEPPIQPNSIFDKMINQLSMQGVLVDGLMDEFLKANYSILDRNGHTYLIADHQIDMKKDDGQYSRLFPYIIGSRILYTLYHGTARNYGRDAYSRGGTGVRDGDYVLLMRGPDEVSTQVQWQEGQTARIVQARVEGGQGVAHNDLFLGSVQLVDSLDLTSVVEDPFSLRIAENYYAVVVGTRKVDT